MINQTLPRVETGAEPIRKDQLIVAAVFGVGGLATFGWVALLGWGLLTVIGSLTG